MSPPRRTAVVVGNPKPASRTLEAASYVARRLSGEDDAHVVDLALLGAGLLDRSDPEVARLVEEVAAADLVVVASPTYKGSITGLLKLFLDRFAPGDLRGVVVPLMLGGGAGHALAPELALRPVLAELRALVPVRGLYVLDRQHDDPAAYDAWLDEARPVVRTLLDHLPRPTGVPA